VGLAVVDRGAASGNAFPHAVQVDSPSITTAAQAGQVLIETSITTPPRELLVRIVES
jgi:hypothetical protein